MKKDNIGLACGNGRRYAKGTGMRICTMRKKSRRVGVVGACTGYIEPRVSRTCFLNNDYKYRHRRNVSAERLY